MAWTPQNDGNPSTWQELTPEVATVAPPVPPDDGNPSNWVVQTPEGSTMTERELAATLKAEDYASQVVTLKGQIDDIKSDMDAEYADTVVRHDDFVSKYNQINTWQAQVATDAQQTAADRVQTGLDRTQTGLDVAATGADRIATGADRLQTGQDRVQTGLDRQDAAGSAASAFFQRQAATDEAGLAYGYRADTQGYMNTALGARDDAVAARDVTVAARDVTTGARDAALGYRNEAQGFRNEAENFKNQAATFNPANFYLKTETYSRIEIDTAVNGRVPNTRTVNGKPLNADIALAKADVGLGNVDNTSDANKPISTAVANALAGKANLSGSDFTGPLTGKNATGRQVSAQMWADLSSNGSGHAVFANNLYTNFSDNTYRTAITHAGIGYAALRVQWGAIEVAGFVGATTAGQIVNPTWYPVWHAGNSTPPHGEVQLQFVSAATIQLMPCNGPGWIVINGVPRKIPAAGITLSSAGLATATLYYIYAWMNGANMALAAFPTGYTRNNATGIVTKLDDPAATLVGMVYLGVVNTFDATLVRSWFNDFGAQSFAALTATRSTTSTGATEVNSENRVYFLAWANECVLTGSAGRVRNLSAGQQTFAFVYIDNLTSGAVGPASGGHSTNASSQLPATPIGVSNPLSEGFHYVIGAGSVSGGTGEFINMRNFVYIPPRNPPL